MSDVYVHVVTCVYMDMRACVNTNMYVYTHIDVCVCVCAYGYACMCEYRQAFVRMCVM